jgi:hypothetical protein
MEEERCNRDSPRPRTSGQFGIDAARKTARRPCHRGEAMAFRPPRVDVHRRIDPLRDQLPPSTIRASQLRGKNESGIRARPPADSQVDLSGYVRPIYGRHGERRGDDCSRIDPGQRCGCQSKREGMTVRKWLPNDCRRRDDCPEEPAARVDGPEFEGKGPSASTRTAWGHSRNRCASEPATK